MGRLDRYSGETAELQIPPELQTETEHIPAAPEPRKSGIRRLLRGICLTAAAVFLLYSAASLAMISRIRKLPEGERLVRSATLDRLYVRTVLLIGTDARDAAEERGRSDAVILLTINAKTREISLNSFLRDAYVEIPGHGQGRLNAAYSLGGAELLMDAIEQNYNVSIDDYVCTGFQGLAGMIDALGGVELTLSDAEAEAVNGILRNELNELLGYDETADLLPSGGTLLLNGRQTVAYSRIRYVGNADFERTSRQREVASAISERAKTRAFFAVPALMQDALPYVTTNMHTAELYVLSLRAPFLMGYTAQEHQIPADGTWTPETIDGESVLLVDFAANEARLRDTAFAAERQSEEAP